MLRFPILHSLSNRNISKGIFQFPTNKSLQSFHKFTKTFAFNFDTSFTLLNHKRFYSNFEDKGKNAGNNGGSSNQKQNSSGTSNLLSKKAKTAQDKNTSTGLLVFASILTFIGLSYAAVPLYQTFCAVTGVGGTTRDKKGVVSLSEQNKNESRNKYPLQPLKIYFNADTNSKLPWDFRPVQDSITIIPGETALAFFVAKNRTNEPITGFATYNVTPFKAGSYFNKVQCFCFDEQRLNGGEEIEMPVLFYVDPEIQSNPNTSEIKEIILSYTFFKSKND